jgi:hypothetical protein
MKNSLRVGSIPSGCPICFGGNDFGGIFPEHISLKQDFQDFEDDRGRT